MIKIQINIQIKEMLRVRYVGRGIELSSEHTILPAPPPRVHQPRRSLNPILLEFYGDFII